MVNLLFGIHCHQPVDNFYEVVDQAVEKAYRPFLEIAKMYPDFKFSVHYSGWLLEYISNYHRTTFKLLQELADRGQIEFFTAGYYEPVLSSIPSDDRKYQIEKLNKFIKENFSQTPKGLWLTERVWDPSIVKDVVEVGVEYVIVDDYHFIASGFKKEDLYGYYLTENDGYKLKLFPIDKNLRYIVPFKPFDKIEEYLLQINSDKNIAAIIFDDGEKFGIWPGTYDWVYKNRWLETFIEGVLSSKHIKFNLYRRFAEENSALGLAYLPITSYQEMGEWSLSAEDFILIEEIKKEFEESGRAFLFEKFVKGGIWKNFFVKYPESNRIHKRVLELSIKAKHLKKKNKKFLENLLKAQCNDALWHGIFGGLYLPNLRDNAYRYVIKAEKEIENSYEQKKIELTDIYIDGSKQIKINTGNIIAIISQKGATLTELSIKDMEFNFQNTLSRYKEGYHYRITKHDDKSNSDDGISTIYELSISVSDDLKSLLIYDWHTKNSFIDHITDSINIDSFMREDFRELSNFTYNIFSVEEISEFVSLKAKGYIERIYEEAIIIKKKIYESIMIKNFKPFDDGIECQIRLNTKCPENLIYISEFNLHFAVLDEFFKEKRELGNIKEFIIKDIYTGKNIVFSFDRELNCYTYPLNTISQSEKGVDIINQGLTIGFFTDFCQNLDLKINLKIV